jgi:proteic killer suppression protein
VIRGFKDRDTETVFHRRFVRRLPPDVQRKAHRQLLQIDAATVLETLNIPPGNKLKALAGDRTGLHSIRINDQWRICFRWDAGDAYDVEIVDYH